MKPYISIPLEDYVSQKQYEQAQDRIRSLEVDLALARDEIQELLERARVAEENHKYVVECALRERDEARRDICEREAQDFSLMPNDSGKGIIVNTPQREASRRGWDCFREGVK